MLTLDTDMPLGLLHSIAQKVASLVGAPLHHAEHAVITRYIKGEHYGRWFVDRGLYARLTLVSL